MVWCAMLKKLAVFLADVKFLGYLVN